MPKYKLYVNIGSNSNPTWYYWKSYKAEESAHQAYREMLKLNRGFREMFSNKLYKINHSIYKEGENASKSKL